MPLQFHTSSAARKPPTMQTPFLRTGRTFSLLDIMAFIMVAAAVILSFAAFFYRGHLLRSLSEMDEMLADARRSFEPEFVEEASRLNARIEASKEILSRHNSLSPLFDVLEKKTLQSVRFSNFSFTAPPDASPKISMAGAAKSFNSVALQSDVFSGVKYFTDPVFSDFALDDEGTVLFNFKTTIAQDFLQYAETVIASSTAALSGASFFDDAAATSTDSF